MKGKSGRCFSAKGALVDGVLTGDMPVPRNMLHSTVTGRGGVRAGMSKVIFVEMSRRHHMITRTDSADVSLIMTRVSG